MISLRKIICLELDRLTLINWSICLIQPLSQCTQLLDFARVIENWIQSFIIGNDLSMVQYLFQLLFSLF